MPMSEIQSRCLYNVGDIIVEEGRPGSHICIVEKGKVEVRKNDSSSKKNRTEFFISRPNVW